MFLSLALSCLLQNPAFHWDQEVDQSYWQALHLLEVENDPIGAVEILESLVDEPTVIQYRGQASIVMAQTYRALLRGGRKEEAEQLLPLIRRESLRTEYEARAEEIIAEADSFQNPQGELNEEFLDLVMRQILQPSHRIKDVIGLANAYGDRLTPYLVHYVDPTNNSNTVPSAFRVAIATSNSRVVNEFASHLETVNSQLLLQVIKAVPGTHELDASAKEVYTTFLIQVLRSGRLLPVKEVLRSLATLSTEDERAEKELAAILNDSESPVLPLLLELFAKSEIKINPRTIVGRITANEDEISRALRRSSYETGNPDVIGQLALRGDRNARLTLAVSLLAPNTGETSYSLNGNKVYFFPGPCLPNWRGKVDWVNPDWIRGIHLNDSELKELYLEKWQFLIHDLLNEESIALKELSFLVACRFKDWEFAERALRQVGHLENLPAILYYLPDGWAERLIHSISTKPLGKFAAVRVMDNKVVLSVDQMHKLCQPDLMPWLDNYWGHMLDFDEGPERLAELLQSDIGPPYSDLLLEELLQKDRSNFLEHFKVAIDNRERFGSLSFELGRRMSDYGMKLVDEFRTQGEISEANLQCFQDFLELTLDGYFDRGDLSPGRLSNLSNQLASIIESSTGLQQAFVGLLTTSQSASVIAQSFPQILMYSEIAMETVVAQFPEVIHKGNLRSFYQPLGAGYHVLIDHPNSEVSSFVVHNFGTDKNAQRIALKKADRLISFLDSPNTAAAAARVLVNFGLQDQVNLADKLIAAWKVPDLENRYELMSVVSRFYDPKLIFIISDGLENPSMSVGKKAKEAFDFYEMVRRSRQTLEVWKRSGQSGKPSEFLIEKLSSDQQDVRIAAIESLGTMGAIEALPFLVGLMEDADQEVAAAAAAAVMKINGRQGDMEEE